MNLLHLLHCHCHTLVSDTCSSQCLESSSEDLVGWFTKCSLRIRHIMPGSSLPAERRLGAVGRQGGPQTPLSGTHRGPQGHQSWHHGVPSRKGPLEISGCDLRGDVACGGLRGWDPGEPSSTALPLCGPGRTTQLSWALLCLRAGAPLMSGCRQGRTGARGLELGETPARGCSPATSYGFGELGPS